MSNILIVDDEVTLGEQMCELLEMEGHTAVYIREPEEALKKINAGQFDVLLIDLIMPKMSGVELLQKISGPGKKSKAILMSASQEPTNSKKLWTLFLKKPFDISTVLNLVKR